MTDRRYKPLSRIKTQGPSRLVDLSGRRKPGDTFNVSTNTKVPKQRFKIGDRFEYDGDIWELIYMYRIANEPGIWYHCLEERKEEIITPIGAAIIIMGAGSTTPNIVINPFISHSDATQYFSDRYRLGSSCIKSTQELLKLKKVNS